MRLILASAALLLLSACASAPQTENLRGTHFVRLGAPYFTPEGSRSWVRVSASGETAMALRRTLDGDGVVGVQGRFSPPIVQRRSHARRVLHVSSVLESAAD